MCVAMAQHASRRFFCLAVVLTLGCTELVVESNTSERDFQSDMLSSAANIAESSPACIPETGVCGGPGYAPATCCNGARCMPLLGGSLKKCGPPQCVAVGGECGGPGRPQATCCGDSRCQRLLGGGLMKCIPAAQCVEVGGTCGGPGYPPASCCAGSMCTAMMGGSIEKCMSTSLASSEVVEEETAENSSETNNTNVSDGMFIEIETNQSTEVLDLEAMSFESSMSSCVHQGAVCGCPGCRPTSCCNGARCMPLLGGSVSKCGSSGCVSVGGTCGGPGYPAATCCNGAQCTQLLGGSLKKCQAPQPQCIRWGHICGGPGYPPATCCDSHRCIGMPGGKKRCLR